MANYNETTGSGTTWKRAKQVLIKNELNSTDRPIFFFEEEVAVIGDKKFNNDSEVLRTNYDPEKLISLRDPQTGELTGNVIPQGLVYQALYSLYLEVAAVRDNTPNTNPDNIFTTPVLSDS